MDESEVEGVGVQESGSSWWTRRRLDTRGGHDVAPQQMSTNRLARALFGLVLL